MAGAPKRGWYPESGLGKGISLDDRLKELMQELGNAINDSLADSDRIAAAIGEIRKSGYDVFLILEATIGFNKRAEGEEESELEPGEVSAESGEEMSFEVRRPENGIRLKFTSQDQKFLRALKISIEDESGE
jgi:hypothetical protein